MANADQIDDWQEQPIDDWQEVPVSDKGLRNRQALRDQMERDKIRSALRPPLSQQLTDPEMIPGALTEAAESVPLLGPLVKRAAAAIAPGDAEPYEQRRAQRYRRMPDVMSAAQTVGTFGGALAMPSPATRVEGLLPGTAARAAEGAAVSGGDALARGEDPTLAATAGFGVGGMTKVLPSAVRAAGPAAARVVSHVPRADYDYYMTNNSRLRGYDPPSNEIIKSGVDEAVSKVAGEATAANASVADLSSKLDELYEAKRQALSGKATSLAEANELRTILEQEKQVLSEMSKRADDALDASDVTFSKTDLLKFMRQIGRRQGDELISDEAFQSLEKFKSTYQRIKDAAPEQIEAKRLRAYLRQIRNDIDFSRAAGEYDERLNRMRKEFAAGISRTLKDKVPEYATYMDEMSGHASSLDDMSRYFGTPERSIASLERVRRAKSPKDQVPDAVLREHARVTKNDDLLRRIDDWAANRRLMDDMKARDMRGDLFPDESTALGKARERAGQADAQYDRVKRLGPNRTQAIVENQGKAPDARIVGNIEDRKSLEALGEMSGGQDFVQQMRDRGVVNRFYTDRTRGARMAAAGAAIGSNFGPVGAAIGSSAGLGLDKYSGHLARYGMDTASRISEVWNSGTVQQFYGAVRPLVDAARRGNASAALSLQLLRRINPSAYRVIEQEQEQAQ